MAFSRSTRRLAVTECRADGHGPAPERPRERPPSAAGPAAYDRTVFGKIGSDARSLVLANTQRGPPWPPPLLLAPHTGGRRGCSPAIHAARQGRWRLAARAAAAAARARVRLLLHLHAALGTGLPESPRGCGSSIRAFCGYFVCGFVRPHNFFDSPIGTRRAIRPDRRAYTYALACGVELVAAHDLQAKAESPKSQSSTAAAKLAHHRPPPAESTTTRSLRVAQTHWREGTSRAFLRCARSRAPGGGPRA